MENTSRKGNIIYLATLGKVEDMCLERYECSPKFYPGTPNVAPAEKQLEERFYVEFTKFLKRAECESTLPRYKHASSIDTVQIKFRTFQVESYNSNIRKDWVHGDLIIMDIKNSQFKKIRYGISDSKDNIVEKGLETYNYDMTHIIPMIEFSMNKYGVSYGDYPLEANCPGNFESYLVPGEIIIEFADGQKTTLKQKPCPYYSDDSPYNMFDIVDTVSNDVLRKIEDGFIS